MNYTGIKNISIKINDNQCIIAKPNMIDNLYISNINKLGDEIAFIKDKNNNLLANFFIVKLSNEIIEYNLTNNNLKENAFNLLKKKNKIQEVNINFNNGNCQPFIFNSNNNLFIQKNNNDIYLLLSEYDIKYKENLFA